MNILCHSLSESYCNQQPISVSNSKCSLTRLGADKAATEELCIMRLHSGGALKCEIWRGRLQLFSSLWCRGYGDGISSSQSNHYYGVGVWHGKHTNQTMIGEGKQPIKL